MPSAAANVKIDKQQVTPDSSVGDSSGQTPLRQVITLVEHKIRNLEKRKSKLESYRDLQNAGKELNADQKTAVAKYNEVMQTLEFAREIYKQFLSIAVLSEKEAKKQAKKEAAAKSQAELARLREILLVQDALNQMGNENVREDFLHGRNGAAQLSEIDLKLLDDLYPAVTPKHEAGNPTAFMNEVQTAAEHLLAVVDGKPKEVFGGTYTQVKEILGKIHESGYFDQVQAFESYAEVEITETQVDLPQNHEPIAQLVEPPQQQISPMEMRPPVEPLPQPVLQQLPPEQVTLEQQPQSVVPPDQAIYYQHAIPNPPRPISEMLGAGSFFFLQDSEIDTPPEQIPSQTFTNQTYVGGPPPTIPLPTMYVQPNLVNQQPQPPQPRPQPAQAQMAQIKTNSNNGLEENQNIKEKGGQSGANRNSRPNNNNPSYYQNNGYNNNRPRQNRNGPRMGNRHNNNNN